MLADTTIRWRPRVTAASPARTFARPASMLPRDVADAHDDALARDRSRLPAPQESGEGADIRAVLRQGPRVLSGGHARSLRGCPSAGRGPGRACPQPQGPVGGRVRPRP